MLWIWKNGAQGSQHHANGTNPISSELCCPPQPPSFMAADCVIFVCFFQCWQFFQWSKLGHIRKWKQLSALCWETCLLYCKDEGPRILDTLSPSPPLSLSNTINIQKHPSSAWTVFCSDWQHLAQANLKNTYYTLPRT